MDNIAEHYRHIMRYHFHEGLNVAETVGFVKFTTLKERVVWK